MTCGGVEPVPLVACEGDVGSRGDFFDTVKVHRAGDRLDPCGVAKYPRRRDRGLCGVVLRADLAERPVEVGIGLVAVYE